jgi:outer membrane protein assembly factor BamD (BamD/ComL family)
LLGQAQAALASNPAEALAATERHRRLFPNGALVQEREVLAIEALSKLGQTARAKARGDRFLRTFPKSAYRSKVLAMLGEDPSLGPGNGK